MEFPKALSEFMTKEGIDDAGLGQLLTPIRKSGAVRKWRFGLSQPKQGHRKQLIAMSKGTINANHFI